MGCHRLVAIRLVASNGCKVHIMKTFKIYIILLAIIWGGAVFFVEATMYHTWNKGSRVVEGRLHRVHVCATEQFFLVFVSETSL